jgi:hypothetical protein
MTRLSWTKAKKTVAVERHHRVHCGTVSPVFVAPPLAPHVAFDRYQLLLSIGRNLAMRTASKPLIKSLAAGRSALLKHLIDNSSAPLQLSAEVADLGDTALSNLSHDIGVGVSGLHMEAMGFVWRANGKEVLPPGGRFADYAWDTGASSGGVVLSEAKGATSVKSDFDAVDARARDGMFGQVIPHIGDITSDGDDIVGGYAFGVFAAGGQDARTAAYEAMDFTGGLPTSPSVPGGTPSISILKSHFAGVMRLLGLDGDQADVDLLEGQVSFAIYGDDREQFVVPAIWFESPYRPITFDTATLPALSMKVAQRALDLRLGLAEVRDRTDWPRFRFARETLPRGVLAIAPDGLALVSRFGRRGPNVRWKPQIGFLPE